MLSLFSFSFPFFHESHLERGAGINHFLSVREVAPGYTSFLPPPMLLNMGSMKFVLVGILSTPHHREAGKLSGASGRDVLLLTTRVCYVCLTLPGVIYLLFSNKLQTGQQSMCWALNSNIHIIPFLSYRPIQSQRSLYGHMESQGIDVGKVEVMCRAPCDCCWAHDWLYMVAAICTWRHDCTVTYSASCWPQSMSWDLYLKIAMLRVSSSLCIGQPVLRMDMSDFMSPTLAWVQYFGPVIWEGTRAQTLFTPESLPHWTNEKH